MQCNPLPEGNDTVISFDPNTIFLHDCRGLGWVFFHRRAVAKGTVLYCIDTDFNNSLKSRNGGILDNKTLEELIECRKF